MTIIPLAKSRENQARALLGRSFFNYPLMKYALPDDRCRLAATTTLYGALLADALRQGEVVTTTDHAGVACWLPPGKTSLSLVRQIRAGMAHVPFRFGLRGIRRLLTYDRAQHRLHHTYAPGPHWFLAVLGVDADRQGQGVGSALVRPGLERADQQKLSCYLDTQYERNVILYERLGFKVMWEGKPEGHPITTWAMLRPPKPD